MLSFCLVCFSKLPFQENDLYNFHFDLDLMSWDSDLWNITSHAYSGNLLVVFGRCGNAPLHHKGELLVLYGTDSLAPFDGLLNVSLW